MESLANSEPLSNDVVTVRRLLHRCYNHDVGFVTGLWYVAGTLVLGALGELCGGGATNKNPEGQHEKSVVVHVRVPPGQVP